MGRISTGKVISGVELGAAEASKVLTVDRNKRTDYVPMVVQVDVDASGGGTDETETLLTIPKGYVLLNVIANVETAFDGDTTTTFEVGVSGNADNYIDSTDFDPSTASAQASMVNGTTNDQKIAEFIESNTDIIATWTNTASASAGVVNVVIIYAKGGSKS